MPRGFRSTRRKDYSWVGWAGGGGVGSDASATPISLGEAQVTQTCVRIRGQIIASIDGPVDGDRVVVNAGIIIVSADAFAAGSASMPSPTSDLDAPWSWFGTMLLMAQEAVATADGQNWARLEIDSKAMRRMKTNETAALLVQNADHGGAAVIDVLSAGRVLFSTN